MPFINTFPCRALPLAVCLVTGIHSGTIKANEYGLFAPSSLEKSHQLFTYTASDSGGAGYAPPTVMMPDTFQRARQWLVDMMGNDGNAEGKCSDQPVITTEEQLRDALSNRHPMTGRPIQIEGRITVNEFVNADNFNIKGVRNYETGFNAAAEHSIFQS